MEELKTDVAIVGGGPVGLFLACELSYRGVKSIVIEAKPSHVQLPNDDLRPIVLHSRALELMRRVGLEKTFQANAYRQKPQCLNFSFGTGFLSKKPLLVHPFSSWDVDNPVLTNESKLTISPTITLPQSTHVSLFVDHLVKLCSNTATILWNFTATSLVEDKNGVTIQITQSDNPNNVKFISAQYVVGCDGVKSWVRNMLGVHYFGKFEVEGAVSINFKSPELTKQIIQMNRLGGMYISNKTCRGFLIANDTEGMFTLILFCLVKNHQEYYNLVCQNPEKYVHDAIGRKDIKVLRINPPNGYKNHIILASKYREGRVMIAGDAAHQQIQAGGYSLNMGYLDVGNLSWKLAALVQGWGGKHLLDSYQSEVRPMTDSSRRIAMQYAAAAMNPMAPKIIPLCDSIPILHKFMSRMLAKRMKSRFITGSKLMLGYQHTKSNIIVHEYNDECQKNIKIANPIPSAYTPVAHPGCRAPHVVLPDQASIHDIIRKGFVLLVIGGDENDCEYLQNELKSRGVPFDVRAYPKLPDLVQYYDRKYYLIRPDGDISWRSFYQPSLQESQNIVRRVCGDMPHTHFPKSVQSPPQEQSIINLNFLTDISIAAMVTRLINKYTNVSTNTLIAIGLGVAAISIMIRNRNCRKVPFIQGVSRHQAWVTTQFGPPSSSLQMDPSFVGSFGPKDVLIRVRAVSVNRIDIGMRSGYGAPIFTKFAYQRGCSSLFPLILGRDCSGEVVAVGDEVTDFSPGEQVYAAVSMGRQGTYSQYVAVDESEVSLKPNGVDHREAACIPWVAVTVWTALIKKAGLTKQTAQGKRILVHGGAGGVGSFVIQLLKAWGAEVTTTCSTGNISFVHSLGADVAFDYTSGDFSSGLSSHSYDMILDTIGSDYEMPSLSLLKLYSDAKYVSIRSPYLCLVTKYGSFIGTFMYQWIYRYKIFINRLFGGRGFYYSSAEADGSVLETVRDMVEKGEIRPVIEAVYSKDEMIAAHQHVAGGHTRGKVVVDMIA